MAGGTTVQESTLAQRAKACASYFWDWLGSPPWRAEADRLKTAMELACNEAETAAKRAQALLDMRKIAPGAGTTALRGAVAKAKQESVSAATEYQRAAEAQKALTTHLQKNGAAPDAVGDTKPKHAPRSLPCVTRCARR